jgi:hypothetical protein
MSQFCITINGNVMYYFKKKDCNAHYFPLLLHYFKYLMIFSFYLSGWLLDLMNIKINYDCLKELLTIFNKHIFSSNTSGKKTKKYLQRDLFYFNHFLILLSFLLQFTYWKRLIYLLWFYLKCLKLSQLSCNYKGDRCDVFKTIISYFSLGQ